MKVKTIRLSEDGRALYVIEEQSCSTCLSYVSYDCRNHSPVANSNLPAGDWHSAIWPKTSPYDWCKDYTKRPDQSQEVTK